MSTLTVEQLRNWLESVDGDREVRFEDQNGALLGNDATEAYAFNGSLTGSHGENLYVIALSFTPAPLEP